MSIVNVNVNELPDLKVSYARSYLELSLLEECKLRKIDDAYEHVLPMAYISFSPLITAYSNGSLVTEDFCEQANHLCSSLAWMMTGAISIYVQSLQLHL